MGGTAIPALRVRAAEICGLLARGAVAASLAVANRVGLPAGCPIHGATGLLCPGCGGTRAVAALTRLDLLAALDAHPVVVAAVPGAVALTSSAPLRRWARSLVARRSVALFVALALFAGARNLPVDAASLIAPP